VGTLRLRPMRGKRSRSEEEVRADGETSRKRFKERGRSAGAVGPPPAKRKNVKGTSSGGETGGNKKGVIKKLRTTEG